jgi:hypothetical protein
MPKKFNKRYMQLARSIENRLRKLPKTINRGLRSGADRQVATLKRVEKGIDIVAREIACQREELEKDLVDPGDA